MGGSFGAGQPSRAFGGAASSGPPAFGSVPFGQVGFLELQVSHDHGGPNTLKFYTIVHTPVCTLGRIEMLSAIVQMWGSHA